MISFIYFYNASQFHYATHVASTQNFTRPTVPAILNRAVQDLSEYNNFQFISQLGPQ